MRRPKRNSSRPSTASDPVQTFLPYASFRRSARVLDSRRLGKQRVETLQVLRALEIEDYGWKSHPVVRMWRGYTEALVTYGKEMVVEWTRLWRLLLRAADGVCASRPFSARAGPSGRAAFVARRSRLPPLASVGAGAEGSEPLPAALSGRPGGLALRLAPGRARAAGARALVGVDRPGRQRDARAFPEGAAGRDPEDRVRAARERQGRAASARLSRRKRAWAIRSQRYSEPNFGPAKSEVRRRSAKTNTSAEHDGSAPFRGMRSPSRRASRTRGSSLRCAAKPIRANSPAARRDRRPRRSFRAAGRPRQSARRFTRASRHLVPRSARIHRG